MTLQYFSETDMFYIKLSDSTSSESEEVANGIVFDYDEKNNVVGIEIENARNKIDLSRLELNALPITNVIFAERAAV
jgi:uncharacterized protein YuzE